MIKLNELLTIQEDFANSLHQNPTSKEVLFAMNIEVSEFLNTLPWKWWKKNKDVDKEKVLDELADVMAFWLTWNNLHLKNLLFQNVYSNGEEIYQKEVATMQHMIMYAIEHKDANKNNSIMSVNYADYETMHNVSTNAYFLADLIKLALLYTDADLWEITAAYKNKMQENYDRQKRNY